MTKITTIIKPQSFEIIRDQVAIILGTEIPNQVILGGNYELDATVYIERMVPPNVSDLDGGPMVNVMMATGDYDNQDVTQARGTYTYLIDVYAHAKTKATGPGDARAMQKLQRMLGVCRGIIEASQYITLGFNYPFVMGRKIRSLQIAQPEVASADNMVRGRLVLEVKVPESEEMSTGIPIGGSDTKAYLGTTTEGYQYVIDTY